MAHSTNVCPPGWLGHAVADGEVAAEATAIPSSGQLLLGVRSLLRKLARHARAVNASSPAEAANLKAAFEDGIRPPVP